MIYELLTAGSENARTGKELATLLHMNIRAVTAQIERERRDGQPICANVRGTPKGYYLAATPEELEIYCRRLGKREGELYKTRQALLDVLHNEVLRRYDAERVGGAANGTNE